MPFFRCFLASAALALAVCTGADAAVVTNTDSSGPGSLVQALIDTPAGGSVTFDASFTGTGVERTIQLTGPLNLSRDVYIFGPGALALTIRAAPGSPHINTSGITLYVSNLTFADGTATAGGSIYSNGSLLLVGCVFRNNTASTGGGAVFCNGPSDVRECSFEGNTSGNTAGAFGRGPLGNCYLLACTFLGNSSGRGGAVDVALGLSGTTTLENCTFVQNRATSGGGALWADSLVTVTHCTFTGNASDEGAGAIEGSTNSAVLLTNVVATASTAPFGDVRSNVQPASRNCFISLGRDPINSQPFDLVHGVDGHLIGNPNAALGGPLAPTGRALAMMIPLAGSPLLDVALPGLTGPVANDQRGLARPQGAGPDIGAVEFLFGVSATLPAGNYGQPYVSPAPTHTGSAPTSAWRLQNGTLPAGLAFDPATGVIAGTPLESGTYALTIARGDINAIWGLTNATLVIGPPVPLVVTNANDSGAGSLRQALLDVAAGGAIAFAPGVTTISVTTVELQTPLRRFSIDGGATGVTITRPAGGAAYRLMNILPGSDTTLRNLNFTGGRAPDQASAIQISGVATISGCSFYGNSVGQANPAGQSAAVQVDGSATLRNCTFTANLGREAISFSSNAGVSLMENCTVVANTGVGAGIRTATLKLRLRNCLVFENPGGNILGTVDPASSYNLVTTHGPGGLVDGMLGNRVFPANTPSGLGPFGNYGGPGPTFYPTSGSLAVDAAAPTEILPADQRGVPRPFGVRADVGAVERSLAVTLNSARLTPNVLMTPRAIVVNPAVAAPYAFSLVSGSLPPGLTLSGEGVISGIPLVSGTFTFLVLARGTDGIAGVSDVLSLTVIPDLLVTNANDSGAGSLREAIAQAQPLDVVRFDPVFFAVPREIVLGNRIAIPQSVTILGPGSDKLRVNGNAMALCFDVQPGAALILEDLTLTNGRTSGQGDGGAVAVRGTLTAEGYPLLTGRLTARRCAFEANSSASRPGGAIAATNALVALEDCTFLNNRAVSASGGAISLTRSELTALRCHFSGNRSEGALPGDGGAIWQNAAGALDLRDCSFLNNTTLRAGGAVLSPVTAALTNCTFSANSALRGGALALGGADLAPAVLINCTLAANAATSLGGAIEASSDLTAINTILAGNTAPTGANLFFGSMRTMTTDSRNNLFGDPTVPGISAGVNGNQLNVTDPLLAPATAGGSPRTFTRALLSGSPALNAGTLQNAPAADQRGIARPQGPGVDIGAVEQSIFLTSVAPPGVVGASYGPFALTATGGTAPYTWSIAGGTLPSGLSLNAQTGVISGLPSTAVTATVSFIVTDANGLAGSGSQTFVVTGLTVVTNANDSGPGSLRQALADVAPGSSVAFETAFFAVPRTIVLNTPLTLTKSVTLLGPGAPLLTISCPTAGSIFATTTPGLSLTLDALSLLAGSANSGRGAAAIYFSSTGGALTLRRCFLSGTSGSLGLVFANCQTVSFASTTAAAPGLRALETEDVGTISLVNCTFQAFTGQAISRNGTSTISTLVNCTFSDNAFAVLSAGTSLSLGGFTYFQNCLFAGNNGNIGGPTGTMISLGGNAWNTTGGFLPAAQPSDRNAANIELLPLATYGGAVPVRIPACNSIAVDGALAGGAPALDQRGRSRPFGTGVDAGSVEVDFVIAAAPFAISLVGDAIVPVAFSVRGGSGAVTFSACQLPPGLALSAAGVLSGTPTAGGIQPICVQATDALGQVSRFTSNLEFGQRYVVTNGNDSGTGSLRAILAAALDHSVITFDPAVSVVTLTSAALTVSKTLDLDGGTASVRVERAAGAPNFPIFQLTSAGPVSLASLSIENGVGGVLAGTTPLTLTRCVLRLCTEAVRSNAAVTMVNCTVSQNTATYALVLIGLGNQLVHCTVSGNAAGGILLTGTARLTNSIVTRNGLGANAVQGTLLASSTGNVVGTPGTGGLVDNVNGNRIVPVDQEIGLLPLGFYGGPLRTMLLAGNSIAVDLGTPVGAPATDARGVARPSGLLPDAGAFEATLPVSGTPTLGTRYFPITPFSFSASGGSGGYTYALVSGSLPAGLVFTPGTATVSGTPTVLGSFPIVVSATDSNGQVGARLVTMVVTHSRLVTNAADSGQLSLRETIGVAQDGDVITFAPGVTEIVLTSGFITTNRALTIEGGTGGLTIRRTAGTGFLTGTAGSTVRLRNLTIRDFPSTAIRTSAGGALELENCTVTGNVITNGSAVLECAGPIGFTNCTISGNSGGIALTVVGSPTYSFITNCTFGENPDGGLRDSATGSIRLRNSLFSNSRLEGAMHPDSSDNLYSTPSNLTSLVSGQNGNLEVPRAADVGLLPLGNYGGPFQTHLVSSGFYAINAGQQTVFTPAVDQRGVARPQESAPDLGAVEHRLVLSGGRLVGVRNVALSVPYSVSGGTPPYTWSLVSGSLPPGLTLNPSTGLLSGTPTATASSVLALVATDATGLSGGLIRELHVTNTAGPEFLLTGNGVEIRDDSSVPSLLNHTDFGAVPTNFGSITRTFVITNIGAAPLNLTGTPRVSVGEAIVGNFTLVTPPSTPVAPGASTTFTIRFDPNGNGLRTGQLTIPNNDSSELNFSFKIVGTGLDGPVLALTGNGAAILPNTAPALANHTDFGSVSTNGATVTRTYTLTNTGTPTLHLGNITLNGSTDFVITVPPGATTLTTGATTTIGITFNPSSVGLLNSTLTILSDDLGQPSFVVLLQGTGLAEPEMEVTGNGMLITSGDTTPSLLDDTDFGFVSVPLNQTSSRTYTITNSGTGPLSVGTVTLSGAAASEFAVIAQPATSVAPGASITFTVRFDPIAALLRTATVSFPNGDLNESPFTFAIQGNGTAPEIVVRGNGSNIGDGSTSPSTANLTDFGSTHLGTEVPGITVSYTIQNTGSEALNVGAVSVSGTHAADFSVVAQPPGSIAAGGSATFSVLFKPSATGLRSAALSFPNNDSNENPFNFSIQGTGVNAPEISVLGNGLEIVSGSIAVSRTLGTDFGSVLTASGSAVRTFTIRNTGSANLTFSAPTLTGTHFTLLTPPVSPVAAGASTTFQLRFDPSSTGALTSTVTLANNDSNEASYTFLVGGTGLSGPPTQIEILGFARDGTGHAVVTFTSVPGVAYQIQSNPNLSPGTWTTVDNVTPTDTIHTWTAPTVDGPKAFYRVVLP